MEPTANTPAMTDQERAAAIEQLELQAKELGHSLVSLSAPTVAEKVKEILSLSTPLGVQVIPMGPI